jgi:hypothetical protein
MWLELDRKREERKEAKKKKPTVFDGIITEYTMHTTTRVL